MNEIYVLIAVIIISFIIGIIGLKRNIGFVLSFFISITLNPILGFFITIWTDSYQKKKPQISTMISLVGIALFIFGIIIIATGEPFIFSIFEPEYDLFYVIKTGIGVMLLGVFNFENGRGKTFAHLDINDYKIEDNAKSLKDNGKYNVTDMINNRSRESRYNGLDDIYQTLSLPIPFLLKMDIKILDNISSYFVLKGMSNSKEYLCLNKIERGFENRALEYINHVNSGLNRHLFFLESNIVKHNFKTLKFIVSSIQAIDKTIIYIYQDSIVYLKSFNEIGERKILNKEIFITRSDYSANEKNIFNHIEVYNEYLLQSTGEGISTELKKQLVLYFSISGLLIEQDSYYYTELFKRIAPPWQSIFNEKIHEALINHQINYQTYQALLKIKNTINISKKEMIDFLNILPK